MENIGEKIKNATEKSETKESSEKFNSALARFFDRTGLNEILKDLNRFKDPKEKIYLERLYEEIQKSLEKIKEFNNSQIESFKTLLAGSLPADTKKSDYERRKNESNKEEIILAGNVLKDKMKIIEKIDKIKNAADNYKMGAKFIKANNNSETYISSEIKDLNDIQDKIAKLSDTLDKYARLLKKEIEAMEK